MKYLALLTTLILIVASCSDGTFSDDQVIATEDPTEIEGAFFSGKVINSNNLIADATVSVYQNGQKIGETLTDANGDYNTASLELKIGTEVTIEVLSESFNQSIRRLTSDNKINENVDFDLLSKSEYYGGGIVAMPGDSSLIRIYGTFSDDSNNPIINYFAFVCFDQQFNGISTCQATKTDANGYFELLVEPKADMEFNAFRFTTNNSCNTIAYLAEEIGFLTEDLEMPNKPGLENIEFISIGESQFLDCSGNPMSEVKYYYQTSYGNTFGPNDLPHSYTDIDGNISFKYISCDAPEKLYRIINTRDDNGFDFSTVVDATNEGINSFPVIEACLSNNTNYGTADFQVWTTGGQGTTRILDIEQDKVFNATPETNEGFYAAGQTGIGTYRTIFFKIPNIQLGENSIEEFRLGERMSEGVVSTNGTLKANVTSLDNGVALGTWSGETTLNNGQSVRLEGSFELPLN